MRRIRSWARRAGLPVLAVAVAAAAVLALPSCGSDAGPLRARLGGVVPPLADVKWVPQYPLGDEPSVFNEPPLRGKVVVFDFYASW
ncbi:MAG: hypothetical protein ACYTGX_12900 [Planctomycetota bacterium]|jgi:hypothetical protein